MEALNPNALKLLERARAAGLTVAAENGRLLIRGPATAEPLVRELAAHKAELLALLQPPQPLQPSQSPQPPQPPQPRPPRRTPPRYQAPPFWAACAACGARTRFRWGGEPRCVDHHPLGVYLRAWPEPPDGAAAAGAAEDEGAAR